MFQSIVASLILSAAAFLFPLAWHSAQLFLAKELDKLPSAVHATVVEIVGTVVRYIEQVHPELAGADKKVQALSVIQDMLASKHLSVTPQELDVLLEESVFLMNQSKPVSFSPAPLGFAPAAASVSK